MTLIMSLSIAQCCVIAVYLALVYGAPEKGRNGQRQQGSTVVPYTKPPNVVSTLVPYTKPPNVVSTVVPYTKPPNVVNVTACRPDILGVSNPGFCCNRDDLDGLCTFLEVSDSPTYCAKFIGNYCCYQSLDQGNEVSSIANPRRRIRKRPSHRKLLERHN